MPASLDTDYFRAAQRGVRLSPGSRLRSRSPPPLTFKSLTIQVLPTLAQFLPVPLLHLVLRYDCTMYVRPRRPCICLPGTPICQCHTTSLRSLAVRSAPLSRFV